jgi:ABC-type Fe3+-hydroxamate transport system substrate-binding protein
MRTFCVSPVWLLIALLWAPACRNEGSGRSAAGGPRVISLHDVTTELVVALGAAQLLVGVSEPVEVSDELRAQLAPVPRVGGLEMILSARPSLVLGLGVVAEQDPALVARLRSEGIDVYLGDPQALDGVFSLTREVADRVRAPQAGQALLARLRAQADRAPPPAGRPLRVFVYDCCAPPFTAGGKTVLSDLIQRAGGQNLFADLETDWTHVSWEEVVARRPELIVIHSYRLEGDEQEKRRALRAIPALAEVPTTVLPLGCSLGGLRSLEGLERLRAAIGDRS